MKLSADHNYISQVGPMPQLEILGKSSYGTCISQLEALL